MYCGVTVLYKLSKNRSHQALEQEEQSSKENRCGWRVQERVGAASWPDDLAGQDLLDPPGTDHTPRLRDETHSCAGYWMSPFSELL